MLMISWGFPSKCDNLRVTLQSYKRPTRVFFFSSQQNGKRGQSSASNANPLPTYDSCHLYLADSFSSVPAGQNWSPYAAGFLSEIWDLNLLPENWDVKLREFSMTRKTSAGNLQGSLDTSKGRLYIQCPAVWLGRCAKWITAVQDGIWRVCTCIQYMTASLSLSIYKAYIYSIYIIYYIYIYIYILYIWYIHIYIYRWYIYIYNIRYIYYHILYICIHIH